MTHCGRSGPILTDVSRPSTPSLTRHSTQRTPGAQPSAGRTGRLDTRQRFPAAHSQGSTPLAMFCACQFRSRVSIGALYGGRSSRRRADCCPGFGRSDLLEGTPGCHCNALFARSRAASEALPPAACLIERLADSHPHGVTRGGAGPVPGRRDSNHWKSYCVRLERDGRQDRKAAVRISNTFRPPAASSTASSLTASSPTASLLSALTLEITRAIPGV